MLYIIGPKDKGIDESRIINTTSRSKNWSKGLSPFFVGPIELYNGYISKNMECAWQYSKVYARFLDKNENPKPEYFEWAKKGWNSSRAIRYPMGKGVKPIYSWWDGEKLSYIEARKKIYIPLYAKAVQKTKAFKKLKSLYEFEVELLGNDLFLWDFDGFNHKELGLNYEDVINNSKKSLGHAFVLAMLLEKKLII